MTKRFQATRYSLYEKGIHEYYSEYRDEALTIIDEYLERYQKRIEFWWEPNAQYGVRAWLHKKAHLEARRNYVSPQIHDLQIRAALCIDKLSNKEKKLLDESNIVSPFIPLETPGSLEDIH